MKQEPSTQIDPFSPTILDETTELRALSRALELAKGFKLLFVRCNQAEQRRGLINKLRTELPSLKIQEIQLTEPALHLLDVLRGNIQTPVPDALFVYGLEYSFPSAAEAPLAPLVANLNASRNSFPEVIGCSFVLWVPEFVLHAIMLGAPDFFSIRSGVYYFAAGTGETADLVQSLVAGRERFLEGLSLKEKIERVKAIESLLADYEALPADKRDLAAEVRLRQRLGNLCLMLRSYEAARVHFERAREQAKALNDVSAESRATNGLGIVYSEMGSWIDARTALERALELSRQLGDRDGEAMDLRNLGNLEFQLGRLEEARGYYEQSLSIIRDLGDKVEESAALLNLGNIFNRTEELVQVEELLKKALKVADENADRDIKQRVFQTLGAVYYKQGRLLEAEEVFRKSLQIATELGGESIWQLLRNLSVVREKQGDLKGASDFSKRCVEILKKVNGKELEPELSRLADLESKVSQQEAQKQPV